MGTVLVVDDEPGMVKILAGFLAQEKIPCLTAGDADQALRLLNERDVALVITDLRMPGKSGLELLEEALAIDPTLQVILITAHGTAEIGQKAWELGAAGYVRKPFDRDEILFEVRRALAKGEAVAESSAPAGAMIGGSQGFRQIQSLIAKIAPTSSTVLIRGESGTGKELVARALHAQSPRRSKPFVKVVCAALPETLIESELFGYEKGAFTGAALSKPGRFELAQGGTIFLDEIGDLSPSTQVKLLRVLQDRQFERLGGTETIQADVRVLAATHRPLETMLKEGRFREDLYYRLNVVPIVVPPLRDRREDIAALSQHFLTRFRQEHGKGDLALAPEALAALQEHAWPGNIRELQNVLERLVILTQSGRIVREDVASCLAAAGSAAPADARGLNATVAQAEKVAIEKALAETVGNRTRAAKLLGISRRGLHNKLREYGIDQTSG